MSAPVLAGIAGVLVAAVGTGVLAGSCFRRPGLGRVTWTAASLGLAVALVAQSMGFADGFDQATFRAVQLSALVLVPLGLSWGLVELAVENDAVRFGTRLIAAALAVVVTVILATDPLSARPFGMAWPLTSDHFQPIARTALDVVQAAAVLVALACAGLVLAGRGLKPPLAAALPSGLAVLVTAGLRFPLPSRAAYPLLSTAAVGLVLFGASRIGQAPGDRIGQAPGEAYAQGQVGDRGGRRGGVRDDGGRYRSGDEFWPEDAYRPADGSPPGGQYPPYGQRPGYPGRGRPSPGNQPQAQAQPSSQPPSAAARPYGRIQIFTLLDDRVAEFDRLAEEMTERVTGEPDTLVYVIHLVPNAPLQRIFYEVYRDRAAFDSHESQPYVQRFAAERRALVLATNIIELGLKYAKVAPLPAPPPAMPGAAPPQAPRSQPMPAAAGRGPQRAPGPLGPAGDPRLQPPPPPPPPGRPPRYEPRRPDPRQVPSTGRPYGT